MASFSTDARGNRRILFLLDRQRKQIRLGKLPMKACREIQSRIEAIVESREAKLPLEPAVARWLLDLEGTLREKLVAVGLADPLEERTLGPFIASYIDGRAELKPNTIEHLQRARRELVDLFGEFRQLGSITPGDAADFREFLRKGMPQIQHAAVMKGARKRTRRPQAENTVRRTCSRARQFFEHAVKKGAIAANPFGQMKKLSVQTNKSREAFVTRAMSELVLDACPDAEWRLLFALCRFGGLRCPSEVLLLTWSDVDWERSRIRVTSPKTAHHEGKGFRWISIFEELKPYLEAAFDDAAPGTKHVINRYRGTNINLRTQLTRIIDKAGVDVWPKLFQNLRSTRETELAENFPIHVVCEWIGNSEAVARKHYLQVTEEHFEQASGIQKEAAQNPAQSGPELLGNAGPTKNKTLDIAEGFNTMHTCASVQAPRKEPSSNQYAPSDNSGRRVRRFGRYAAQKLDYGYVPGILIGGMSRSISVTRCSQSRSVLVARSRRSARRANSRPRGANLMPPNRSLPALAILCAVCANLGAARGAPFTFQGVGELPGGGAYSDAHSVSANGVVVGRSISDSGLEAARWTSAGGMVGLGDLPGGTFESEAYNVSADGSVVVGYSRSAISREAFIWTAAGGMVGLGDFPGGETRSEAWDVSADGTVVVGYGASASGREAFRWTAAGGMVGLGDLPGGVFESYAFDASADGNYIVGQGYSANGNEAFLWSASGGMIGLGELPGGVTSSGAFGVSDDGLVVVGRGDSAAGLEAFRWTAAGGMVGLGDFSGGSFASIAWATSANGSVVVGRGTTADGFRAFRWTAEAGMEDLRDMLIAGGATGLDGWTLNHALGISADGLTIVGVGTNPSGASEAFIATIPEPDNLWVAVLGALGMVLVCRRQSLRRGCSLRSSRRPTAR